MEDPVRPVGLSDGSTMNTHTLISEDLWETAHFVNLDRRLHPPSKQHSQGPQYNDRLFIHQSGTIKLYEDNLLEKCRK